MSEQLSAARAALEAVGMQHRLSHRPRELSGGQQQRVAIARAFAADPELLLADEPTGNLDCCSGEEVLGLLRRFNAGGKTVVMVTHDVGLAERCGRVITFSDGKIVSDREGYGAKDGVIQQK